MPAERVPMRQVREILRLTFSGDVAGREIARRLGIAPSTVRAVVERFRLSGLSWPLSDDMSDEALEEQIYSTAGSRQGHRRQAEPDFSQVHRELKRKHVTLSILWEEYIEQIPEGYRYSRFCELYRNWTGRLSVTMRQSHAGGDKLIFTPSMMLPAVTFKIPAGRAPTCYFARLRLCFVQRIAPLTRLWSSAVGLLPTIRSRKGF
jgi:transposase-like protein